LTTTLTRLSFGMSSDGATSPERRAQSVPIDPNRIKLRQNQNKFQPLAEHNSADSDKDRDRVREGSISNASSSKGSRKREPISLTLEILLLLDILEPDKGRHAKLLTEHLIGQGVLPSIEEELLQHLEHKAKREVERHQAAEEKAKYRASAHQHASFAQEVIHTDIVATFGRRVREAALAAGAMVEQAMEAEKKATVEVEASMANASAMRE